MTVDAEKNPIPIDFSEIPPEDGNSDEFIPAVADGGDIQVFIF